MRVSIDQTSARVQSKQPTEALELATAARRRASLQAAQGVSNGVQILALELVPEGLSLDCHHCTISLQAQGL